MDSSRDDSNWETCQWQELFWPNTVYLSLLVERSSDLFLFNSDALPALDHLCVTLMKSDEHIRKNIETDLKSGHVMNITDRLRSLQLCYMSLGDLLTFLSSIYMPVLEKLTLIEIYDDSKYHKLI